jgi:hypothetical protein
MPQAPSTPANPDSAAKDALIEVRACRACGGPIWEGRPCAACGARDWMWVSLAPPVDPNSVKAAWRAARAAEAEADGAASPPNAVEGFVLPRARPRWIVGRERTPRGALTFTAAAAIAFYVVSLLVLLPSVITVAWIVGAFTAGMLLATEVRLRTLLDFYVLAVALAVLLVPVVLLQAAVHGYEGVSIADAWSISSLRWAARFVGAVSIATVARAYYDARLRQRLAAAAVRAGRVEPLPAAVLLAAAVVGLYTVEQAVTGPQGLAAVPNAPALSYASNCADWRAADDSGRAQYGQRAADDLNGAEDGGEAAVEPTEVQDVIEDLCNGALSAHQPQSLSRDAALWEVSTGRGFSPHAQPDMFP